MKIKDYKTKVFIENENLILFIEKYIKSFSSGSILVITSKIVALSEGRTALIVNENTREEIIKKESEWAIRTPYAWLTKKDGMIMASAGVDESNADGKLILLPKDSFKSAKSIRDFFVKKYNLGNFGVIITDSRTMPLRAGVIGLAIGYVGFKGIRDYRGTFDIFNRKLKMTRTDVVDCLAAAAVLCMGEGNEKKPLALITNAPVEWSNKINKKELLIEPEDDLYAPFFKNL